MFSSSNKKKTINIPEKNRLQIFNSKDIFYLIFNYFEFYFLIKNVLRINKQINSHLLSFFYLSSSKKENKKLNFNYEKDIPFYYIPPNFFSHLLNKYYFLTHLTIHMDLGNFNTCINRFAGLSQLVNLKEFAFYESHNKSKDYRIDNNFRKLISFLPSKSLTSFKYKENSNNIISNINFTPIKVYWFWTKNLIHSLPNLTELSLSHIYLCRPPPPCELYAFGNLKILEIGFNHNPIFEFGFLTECNQVEHLSLKTRKATKLKEMTDQFLNLLTNKKEEEKKEEETPPTFLPNLTELSLDHYTKELLVVFHNIYTLFPETSFCSFHKLKLFYEEREWCFYPIICYEINTYQINLYTLIQSLELNGLHLSCQILNHLPNLKEVKFIDCLFSFYKEANANSLNKVLQEMKSNHLETLIVRNCRETCSYVDEKEENDPTIPRYMVNKSITSKIYFDWYNLKQLPSLKVLELEGCILDFSLFNSSSSLFSGLKELVIFSCYEIVPKEELSFWNRSKSMFEKYYFVPLNKSKVMNLLVNPNVIQFYFKT